jgi:hypothetical protein
LPESSPRTIPTTYDNVFYKKLPQGAGFSDFFVGSVRRVPIDRITIEWEHERTTGDG